MTPNILNEKLKLLNPIAEIFELHLEKFGVCPKAAMWRNQERQQMRFEILAGIIAPEDLNGSITINDLGCGYGAFFSYFCKNKFMENSLYYGYDIATKMIDAAKHQISDPRAHFQKSSMALKTADYSIASGPFNYKINIQDTLWLKYVQESLKDLWLKSRKGLAFNMLNHKNPHPENNLFHADAEQFKYFCKEELSSKVCLIDDYDREDWTIYVHR